jgi:hypothetical protein
LSFPRKRESSIPDDVILSEAKNPGERGLSSGSSPRMTISMRFV